MGELGAGYDRNAHVLLSLLPGVRYVVIDIPPALYVAQRYLPSVFPDRKVFTWRTFESYPEIQSEFEHADLAFLLPSQIEMLPDGLFDLFVNISSLHEMRLEVEVLFHPDPPAVRAGAGSPRSGKSPTFPLKTS